MVRYGVGAAVKGPVKHRFFSLAVNQVDQPGVLLPAEGGVPVQAAEGDSVRAVGDQLSAFPLHHLKVLPAVTEPAAPGTDHGDYA